MEALCGTTASLPSTLSPSEKAVAIAKAADEKVTNKEVRELATAMAAVEGREKFTAPARGRNPGRRRAMRPARALDGEPDEGVDTHHLRVARQGAAAA